MYRINPAAYRNSLVVPSSVAEYLKLAGAEHLRAIIWMCANLGKDIEDSTAAAQLGMSERDLSDALYFWASKGVLISDETEEVPVPAPAEEQPKEPEKPQLASIPVVKPTMAQIAARSEEDPEITGMFSEVQKILGRTIGYDTQATLLMIKDTYSLPCEVIVTICGYAHEHGKDGTSYISELAKKWAQAGVDTIEKALEHILMLNNTDKLWNDFRASTGVGNPRPTSKQREYLEKWTNKFGFGLPVILLAYEETADNIAKVNFKYMDKILTSWHNSGVKTEADVNAAKTEIKKEKTGPSLDIEDANRRAIEETPVFKKREV